MYTRRAQQFDLSGPSSLNRYTFNNLVRGNIQIRHIGVHRGKRVSVQAIAEMTKDGSFLTKGMGDVKAAKKLQKLYEAVIEIFEDAKGFLQWQEKDNEELRYQMERLQQDIKEAQKRTRPSDKEVALKYGKLIRELEACRQRLLKEVAAFSSYDYVIDNSKLMSLAEQIGYDYRPFPVVRAGPFKELHAQSAKELKIKMKEAKAIFKDRLEQLHRLRKEARELRSLQANAEKISERPVENNLVAKSPAEDPPRNVEHLNASTIDECTPKNLSESRAEVLEVPQKIHKLHFFQPLPGTPHEARKRLHGTAFGANDEEQDLPIKRRRLGMGDIEVLGEKFNGKKAIEEPTDSLPVLEEATVGTVDGEAKTAGGEIVSNEEVLAPHRTIGEDLGGLEDPDIEDRERFEGTDNPEEAVTAESTSNDLGVEENITGANISGFLNQTCFEAAGASDDTRAGVEQEASARKKRKLEHGDSGFRATTKPYFWKDSDATVANPPQEGIVRSKNTVDEVAAVKHPPAVKYPVTVKELNTQNDEVVTDEHAVKSPTDGIGSIEAESAIGGGTESRRLDSISTKVRCSRGPTTANN